MIQNKFEYFLLCWEMHILSSFLPRPFDALSLALPKYLLWVSLEFTTIVLRPTAQHTVVLPV